MPKGPGGVIVFGGPFLSGEPPVKRAVAFFDGQNLFYSVRSAFGYTFPNCDVVALAVLQCGRVALQVVRDYVELASTSPVRVKPLIVPPSV